MRLHGGRPEPPAGRPGRPQGAGERNTHTANRKADESDSLPPSLQTSLFIQALNDDLVKVALQDMNNQACSSSHLHSNGLLCEVSPGDQEGAPRPQDNAQNRVEEWASWRTGDRVARSDSFQQKHNTKQNIQ